MIRLNLRSRGHQPFLCAVHAFKPCTMPTKIMVLVSRDIFHRKNHLNAKMVENLLFQRCNCKDLLCSHLSLMVLVTQMNQIHGRWKYPEEKLKFSFSRLFLEFLAELEKLHEFYHHQTSHKKKCYSNSNNVNGFKFCI